MYIATNTSKSQTNVADKDLTVNSVEHASDWNGHEHVSEQVQLEAEKLVHLVGSSELAIHAINVVEQRHQDLAPGDDAVDSEVVVGRNADFLKVLTDFETSLATPVVSGELTEWVTIALQSCEQLIAILRDDLQRVHSELFAGILRQDLDLSSQVEKLRETDKQLALVECNDVASSLEQLLKLATSAKQDEAKLDAFTAEAIKQSMEFVIAARTQETAIATWYSEAFHRDLGSGD